MPCQAPIEAHRPAIGGPVSFTGPKKDGRAYVPVQIPCGYCLLCREEQARQQAVRIYHEALRHDLNAFITLTYHDKHLPPHGGLHYEHLFKFWKRIKMCLWRKHQTKLRYYAVGEYGSKSLRPHYHACVFGFGFTEGRIIVQTEPYLLWTSPELEKAWGLGHVRVGALNFATARYTASYMTKKLRSKQRYVYTDTATGELISLAQPRSFMSRNLGKEWWIENHKHVTAHDAVIIDGHPQKPPRAYDKWLTAINEKDIEKIKERRKKRAEKLSKKQTHARAEIARARAKQHVKQLN